MTMKSKTKKNHSNVIDMPKHAKREMGNAKEKQEKEGLLVPLPPKQIKMEEALAKLQKMLGDSVEETAPILLFFPKQIKCLSFPSGVEFYDVRSKRPHARKEGEDVEDLQKWVKSWYLGFFREGDKTIGLMIYNDHPAAKRLIRRVIADKDIGIKDGFKKFVQHASLGDSPD